MFGQFKGAMLITDAADGHKKNTSGAPYYYLQNFEIILQTVVRLYGDILPADTGQFCQLFLQQPLAAKALYVRLLSRKGPVFRSDTCCYKEIDSTSRAIQSLRGVGLLRIDPPTVDQQIATLFTTAQLRGFLRQAGHSCSGSKQQLLEAVQPHAAALTRWAGATFFSLQGLEHVNTLRLLFFGNAHQDLNEFIIAQLGIVRYEQVEISSAYRLYQSETELLQAREWLRIAALIEQNPQLNTVQLVEIFSGLEKMAIAPRVLRRFEKLLIRIAHVLEKQKAWAEARRVYAAALQNPHCLYRWMRMSEHLGKWQAVSSRYRAGAQEKLCHTTYQLPAWRSYRRARKKLGLACEEVPAEAELPQCQIVLPGRDPQAGLELQVAQYFETQGRGVCLFVENSLWAGLFYLSFWDIIFKPVQGAFTHPFQRGPHDFFSSNFFLARRELIDQRLDKIRRDAPRFFAWLRWVISAKHGIATWGVDWQLWSLAFLRVVRRHIKPAVIATVLQRIAQNPGAYLSGLPDLILFTSPGNFELFEVKGPGDAARHNQREWILFFNRHSIPASFVHVRFNA